ncbi:MAG: hypothetical protein QHH07_10695 [Sedimentisphaerales bacterium]|jgi:F-type H+-transporting ATPase subunit alpha|nr:hypothetical protein [Sedimentisphaerales bacterium]
MAFDLTEMAEILRNQLEQYKAVVETARAGRVVGPADGIAHIYGLDEAMVGEVLWFENEVIGEVFDLEQDRVGAVIYGDYIKVKEGSEVVATGSLMSVPVSEQLLGRVVNPLCQPVDGGPPITATKARLIESPAPGIAERQPVREPLQTGIKAIDSMIPIGRGQRELIIGDRKTGKTAIAIDTIINQKDQDVICIYVAIRQRAASIAEVVDILSKYECRIRWLWLPRPLTAHLCSISPLMSVARSPSTSCMSITGTPFASMTI